jgi:hypothetical protein
MSGRHCPTCKCIIPLGRLYEVRIIDASTVEVTNWDDRTRMRIETGVADPAGKAGPWHAVREGIYERRLPNGDMAVRAVVTRAPTSC